MNKPPSYLIYPSSNNRLNSLLFVLAKEKGYLDLRPVHRLDKNTSGVCILAKVHTIRGFFIFISDRKKISNYSKLSMKICFFVCVVHQVTFSIFTITRWSISYYLLPKSISWPILKILASTLVVIFGIV